MLRAERLSTRPGFAAPEWLDELGRFVGGLLLGVVPSAILLPVLAAVLVFSAFKVWGHRNQTEAGNP